MKVEDVDLFHMCTCV